jgi:hypothetical protein
MFESWYIYELGVQKKESDDTNSVVTGFQDLGVEVTSCIRVANLDRFAEVETCNHAPCVFDVLDENGSTWNCLVEGTSS